MTAESLAEAVAAIVSASGPRQLRARARCRGRTRAALASACAGCRDPRHQPGASRSADGDRPADRGSGRAGRRRLGGGGRRERGGDAADRARPRPDERIPRRRAQRRRGRRAVSPARRDPARARTAAAARSRCWASTVCWLGSTSSCGCSAAGRVMHRRASRRCAPRFSGAMHCSMPRRSPRSDGSRCSPIPSPSKRPSRCALPRAMNDGRCSTRCTRWSKSRSSPRSRKRTAGSGCACS